MKGIMSEDNREANGNARQEDRQRSALFLNNDTNEHIGNMAEFQRAIDRLRLRRQSSSSNHTAQGESSGNNSAIKDLFQGQTFRAPTTTFSSTCTSPISSNGAYFLNLFLLPS